MFVSGYSEHQRIVSNHPYYCYLPIIYWRSNLRWFESQFIQQNNSNSSWSPLSINCYLERDTNTLNWI